MEKYRQELRALLAGVMPGKENALVFGEGPCCPRLMLIGEAPGEQETLQGRPFVGKAGKNLDGFLEAVGLQREEIWISNVVKIRPTKVSDKGRVSNRPPSREELALFTPFLMEEILLVQPRLIVTLGNVPLKAILDPKAVIGAVHGQLQQAEYNVFPLYHPASIVYNRALKPVYTEDVLKFAQLATEMGWR